MKLMHKIMTAAAVVAFSTAVFCGSASAAEESDVEYSIADVTNIQKYAVGMSNLSSEQMLLYDMNGDGKVDIADASIVQKLSIGYKLPTTFKINNTELLVGAGESEKIVVTTDSDDFGIAYSSSDTTVADVDGEGRITGVKAGFATIKVSVAGGFSAECTVTVMNSPKNLTINKTSLLLGSGETYKLKATVDSGAKADLTYTTSNKNAAVVDKNGKITAVGAGTANITVKTYNGLKKVCTVNVKNLAKSVSLDRKTLTLGVGEKYDLSSTVPANTAAFHRVYSSGSPTVATVNGAGLVVAKKAGKTVVKCKLINGAEGVCTVTVKPAPTKLTISETAPKLKVGQSKTLKITPSSGSYCTTYSWTSSNTAVAQVNSKGVVSTKSLGTATITCKSYNGQKVSCKLTVSGSVVRCIDVSTWQGYIDYNSVKASGCNYVIMRAGFSNTEDNMFEHNYVQAKKAGLKVGVYWYSYAMNSSQARKEADSCLKYLKGKKLDMPVYYDMEHAPAIQSLSRTVYTGLATTFCDKIAANGFKPGIYASASVFGYPLNYSTLIAKKYSIWNAEWSSSYSVPCDIWQYSEKGNINGIYGAVDLDWIYNLNIIS